MRPAKLPAAFCCKSVIVVDEFTNALVTIPFATSGTALATTPTGHPVPSGLQPFVRFHCCTVAVLKLGSKTTMLGAVPRRAGGGERNVEGCTVGTVNCWGKPCERRV